MNNKPTPFLEQAETIANGFRDSQVFLTAIRLNLFGALGTEQLTAKELASKLSCKERGVQIVCDALTGLGLLQKDAKQYRNLPDSLELLCDSSSQHRLHQFNHMALLYERWGHLESIVRSGTIPPRPAMDQAKATDDRRRFALAMMNIGAQSATITADALDLQGAKSLLDVGGGPGMYALEFARRNPELRAVVLDDAETLKVTTQMISEADLADRVSVHAGNIFSDRPKDSFDFVFVSNVIHQYSFVENQTLVAQCAELLNPGGRLCLKDFFLNANRTSPAWSTLFAVNMLVNTENGNCYTVDEGNAWFDAAGLDALQPQPVAKHSMMLSGQKPV